MNRDLYDNLGDYCKACEEPYTLQSLPTFEIPIARLDGRAFHTLTKDLAKFSPSISRGMQYAAERLVSTFGASIAYVQSDEITLVWKEHKDLPFNGRIQKLCSTLAAAASVYFTDEIRKDGVTRLKTGVFDCRIWSVKNKEAALQTLIWRQMDCVKNSINTLSSTIFSHKDLLGVSTDKRLQKLKEAGIDWSTKLDPVFKFGTIILKQTTVTKFKPEELEKLPRLHMARTNPNFEVTRTVWKKLSVPPLTSENCTNGIDVVFNSEIPKLVETDSKNETNRILSYLRE